MLEGPPQLETTGGGRTEEDFMRRVTRSVVVVCLLAGSLSLFAAPREAGPRGGDIVKRIVKKIRTLGDGLTIPGTSPAKP